MKNGKCPAGEYYCYTNKECKPIPKGFMVDPEGMLRKENGASTTKEEWSQKYKKSIDCDNPKGFSQRAHCQGKKKMSEESNPRIPRKKGQPANSKKHSDLYTDENPKGTIHGLGFKDVATAKASVSKIRNSSRSHAHKIQAAVAMEQRAREMGKTSEAAVYRKYINSMKKKTKEMKNIKEEGLRDWFGKSKSKDGKKGWVNVVTGDSCASDKPGEGIPKCVSSAKRASMSKKERLAAAAAKRREDPGQQKKTGAAKPTNVKTDRKTRKESVELVDAYGETFATIQDIIKPEPMKETVCPRCGQNPCVCSETYDIESMTEAKDRKGKGSGTKDACYHKVKSRYSVWPSAYASGALVKCRKVGAANWGNKTKKEEFEFSPSQVMALEAAGLIQLNEKGQKCWKGYEKKGTKKMFGKTYNNCVKKEEFVAEEESDRRKDERQERGGVDGNTDYKRPAKNNTKKFGTGKTAMQKEMEKKHGKGKSAMEIVTAEIRAKHKKKEDKKENTNEERIRINQNGHTYAVMLNWRGKTYTVQIFFPELRKPTRQEVEDKIRKIYPDAKVTYFAPKEFDPADPTVMVGEQREINEFFGLFGPKTVTPKDSPSGTQSVTVGKKYPARQNRKPVDVTYDKEGNKTVTPMSPARAGLMQYKYGSTWGLQNNSFESEGEVIDERKMTDGEMKKEKKLRKKYDKGDMKKSMKDQYGEEEGKKIYFAKIRKIAMEGKYSSSVRATYGGKTETFPVEVYKKKSKQTKVAEGKGDPCWDTHKQVGMKKKGGKMVPNCVPKEEVVLEMTTEKDTDKKLQKPIDTKKLNPAKYLDNMGGTGSVTGKKKMAETAIKPGTDITPLFDAGQKQNQKRRMDTINRIIKGNPKNWDFSQQNVDRRMMSGESVELDKKRSPKKIRPARPFPRPSDPKPPRPPGPGHKEPLPPFDDPLALNRKSVREDWQKKSGKNPEGGLNEKGRKSYERENPGSDLKAPTKKKGNPRRASFCARMKGMKKKLTSKKTANDPDSRINKSLRKWDC